MPAETILVFTLGTGQKQSPKPPAHDSAGAGQAPAPAADAAPSRYRLATYLFSDGKVSEETPFFGISLLRWLQASGKKLTKLVVAGTSSSIWDALLDVLPKLDDVTMEYHGILEARVRDRSVSDSDVRQLEEILSQWLEIPTHCRVIPLGQNNDEQLAILELLAAEVPPRAELHMCVTHGLRHLPMLQMLSVFQLVLTHQIKLGGLYYGALELAQPPQSGRNCPVIELSGALEIQKWNLALSSVENSGRLLPLAEAAKAENPELAADLQRADHHLSLNQPHRAEPHAKAAISKLRDQQLPGAGRLFSKKAIDLLSWSQDSQFWNQQRLLAEKALASGDFLRATVLTYEAFLSKWVPRGEDVQNFRNREAAEKSLTDWLGKAEREDFIVLQWLRNNAAHGTSKPADTQNKREARVEQLLKKPTELEVFLRQMLKLVTKLSLQPSASV